jgi:hypothetical protein
MLMAELGLRLADHREGRENCNCLEQTTEGTEGTENCNCFERTTEDTEGTENCNYNLIYY